MAAAGRQVNWTGAAATIEGGGSPIPIPKVRSCRVQRGARRLTGSADTDHYPTTQKTIFQEPSLQIVTEDTRVQSVLYPGLRCSLVTITSVDANEDVSAVGNVTYELADAEVGDGDVTGDYQAWANLTLGFYGASANGTTSPLAVVVDIT
jgi:hypothetical protein